MSKPHPSDQPAGKLLERLHAVQRQHAAEPAQKRRATLARELELHLADVPTSERAPLLEQALGGLGPQAATPAGAPAAGPGGVDLEKEALVKERDSLRAKRDALLREIGTLRSELETKRTAPSPPAVSSGSLQAFRAGLKDALAGRKVDPAKLGVPAGDVRLFRLTENLVDSISALEQIRVRFLNTVDVGPIGAMGTQLFKAHQERIRKQVLAVLNDEPGSIKGLQAMLEAQKSFFLGVPDAYEGAIPRGVASLLDELAPEPILARSKKLLTDHERAWSEFTRLHSDLSNLTPEEIWENHFKNFFRERLSDWTKAGD